MSFANNAVCRVVVPVEGFLGVGFAVGDGSIVVTAAHVLGDAKEALLQFPGEPTIHAHLWKLGPADSDIVLLRLARLARASLEFTPNGPPSGSLIAWRYSADMSDSSAQQIRVKRGNTVFPPHANGFPRFLVVAATLIRGMSGGPLIAPETGAVVGVLVEVQHLNAAALAKSSEWEEEQVVAALLQNDVGYAVDATVVTELLEDLPEAAF